MMIPHTTNNIATPGVQHTTHGRKPVKSEISTPTRTISSNTDIIAQGANSHAWGKQTFSYDMKV